MWLQNHLAAHTYITRSFGKAIDKQIKAEVRESGVHESAITVSNFIKIVENQQNVILTNRIQQSWRLLISSRCKIIYLELIILKKRTSTMLKKCIQKKGD